MADQDPSIRLRLLADAAADFSVDSNIPIRRYFRSGQEMVKMADVYHNEGNLEAAYVLYMKYMTLFVEKIKSHRDYKQVLPAEKKKVKSTVLESIGKAEDIKIILKSRYTQEHSSWLREEEARRVEIEKERLRLEEEKKEIERKRLEEIANIERDHQVALWHQAKLDQEDRENRGLSLPSNVKVNTSDFNAPYDPTKYSVSPSPSAPKFEVNDANTESSIPKPSSPTPQYDRSSKPVSVSSTFEPSTSITAPSTSALNAHVPSFDRSAKPVISAPTGLRAVVIPGDLTKIFLNVAKSNSDRGVETLGTLGGSLKNNRFVISHLLIPRQVGKSDSCTMEGLEDVWDVHDKENIIFLGWVHTHPAYSVFLSSVDMHNQYEWQHMLPEALAIVCSIKDNVVGNLRLTAAGMAEIGGCSQTNFHPHSKDLWEESSHVDVDDSKRVILKDLR